MKRNDYFPMFFDIHDWKIVIVGGGNIAARRAETLAAFAEHITVISPSLHEKLTVLREEGKIFWVKKSYEPSDLIDAKLVLICTDNKELNHKIYQEARCTGAFANNCSNQAECDFLFPGIAKKGPAVMGVTAGGTDHKKAKQITGLARKLLEDLQDDE